jgi:hypothetical protein
MQLSDFQKQIVGTILTGETCHIDNCFARYCPFELKVSRLNIAERFKDRDVDPYEDGTVCVVNDESDSCQKLKQFISLWNELERHHLVLSLPFTKRAILPVYLPSVEYVALPSILLLTFFHEFDRKEIVPLPELEEFVRSGYKTREEIKQQEEKRNLQDEIADRKKSQSFTRTIAYVSIAASIVSVVAGGIFNYLTYKTDRTVTITNAKAFPDTTRVYLVNPPANPIDTTQAKKLGGGKK